MKNIALLATTSLFMANIAFAATSSLPTQLPVSANDRNASEITAQLEALGYTSITDTRLSGDIYTAWAEWDGKPVALRIDDELGRIDVTNRSDVETIPADQTMGKDDLPAALKTIGYSDVHDVTKSGNIFCAMASRDGQSYNLRVDAMTGIVTSQTDRTKQTIGAATELSDDAVAANLTGLGYSNPHDVEREGNVISVKATQAGKPVDLNIDARTGAVTVVN